MDDAGVVVGGQAGGDLRGDGAGFLLEALAAGGIGGEAGGENFQGDVAGEAGVAGSIDLAHAADADKRFDFVRTEAISCGERHAEMRLYRG